MNSGRKSALEFLKANVKLITSNAWNELFVKARGENDVQWNELMSILLSPDLGYIPEDIMSQLSDGEIPDQFFEDQTSITNMIIPSNIEIIGGVAFGNCENLKSVKIEDGVAGISQYAFYNCCNLETITIPSSVIAIGSYVFKRCPRVLIKISKASPIIKTLEDEGYAIEYID